MVGKPFKHVGQQGLNGLSLPLANFYAVGCFFIKEVIALINLVYESVFIISLINYVCEMTIHNFSRK